MKLFLGVWGVPQPPEANSYARLQSLADESVCVECLIGKQNKPTLFRSPSRVQLSSVPSRFKVRGERVEIESLQLNLWYLGLVWFIGVTFHDVPFQ